jgi:glycosyltransferase involved in cell wall biosynthesis
MEEKKISIVLPVYNGADYLTESIESVIAQTYANWELIIVNDCSTDDSLAIASKYASQDARIKVFTNPQNLKLPKTLNAGFEHATGVYYTWTSDDNKYKPDALRVMVKNLEKNPDAIMVYADYTCIDSNGREAELAKMLEPKYLFTGNVIGACFLYTADAAKKAGAYDADLFLAEDYDYWIRLYKIGNILHIEDDLYYYRIHGKSLTETKKKYVDEQTYKVLDKHFRFAYTKSVENRLCNEFFDHVLNRASAHYDETLKMLLSFNKKYWFHLNRKRMKILWERVKVFIWYSRLWQIQRRLRGKV